MYTYTYILNLYLAALIFFMSLSLSGCNNSGYNRCCTSVSALRTAKLTAALNCSYFIALLYSTQHRNNPLLTAARYKYNLHLQIDVLNINKGPEQ